MPFANGAKATPTHFRALPGALCGAGEIREADMPSGVRNKLTGQVGEHIVSAMLGTLGYYASPYSGNVPGFDVTAVHSETLKSFPIQVKTSTKGALVQSTIDKWCEHKIDGQNFQTLGNALKLKHPDMIWIMVRLGPTGVDGARFFMCTEAQIQKRIIRRFSRFMAKHGNRRPGGGGSTQAILNIEDLADYENNWSILDLHAL